MTSNSVLLPWLPRASVKIEYLKMLKTGSNFRFFFILVRLHICNELSEDEAQQEVYG